MNREQVKELLPIIQAFAEGKAIQYRPMDWPESEWRDTDDPGFYRLDECRIKPEARLRPWTAEEMPKVFVVANKDDQGRKWLAQTHPPSELVQVGSVSLSAATLLDSFVRIAEDGSEHPCGVISEDAP